MTQLGIEPTISPKPGKLSTPGPRSVVSIHNREVEIIMVYITHCTYLQNCGVLKMYNVSLLLMTESFEFMVPTLQGKK